MSRSGNLTVNGLSVRVHLPAAPEGEAVHHLPPAHLVTPHVVDEYNCPTNWMNGSSLASSYFIGVKAGRHLWIDLNDLVNHTHDVAVVLSVQGINPITGQHTKELRLEKYKDNCPVHNTPFGQERFCKECGYKWPAQNYMSTSSWPRGLFWIDGFRAENGTIRGFLLTEETMKGVAAQIIGEDRVFAIGLGFYLSKNPKPVVAYRGGVLRTTSFGGGSFSDFIPANSAGGQSVTMGGPIRKSLTHGGGMRGMSLSCNAGNSRGIDMDDEGILESLAPSPSTYDTPSPPVEVKKLEIAAGAKISQELCYPDPNPLDHYQDTPAGMIYLNYATEGDVEKILRQGRRDQTAGGEGFLKGLNTGNPVAVK